MKELKDGIQLHLDVGACVEIARDKMEEDPGNDIEVFKVTSEVEAEDAVALLNDSRTGIDWYYGRVWGGFVIFARRPK